MAAGDHLVIASNTKGKVASSLSSEYLKEVSATFSSDNLTIESLPSSALVLTLGGASGNWTLANGNGLLLGATAVKKLAFGEGTTLWSISITNTGTTIQNGTSKNGRLLHNVNNARFTTYTSDANTSMLLPQIYRLESVLPSLATPKVLAEVQDVNSVYAFWGEIAGAKDYTVTCGEQTFTTAATEYTFTDLAYSTEYTVSVVANPSDETTNAPSAAGKSEIVKTGANPAGGSMTYTLDSDAIKAAHSSAWSYTSGSKTITAKDGSKWTAYNTFANKNQITIQMNKGKTAYVLTPKFDGKSITNIAIENVKTADGTGIGSKPIDILSADGKTTIASGISGETLTKGIVVDGTYDQLRIICNEKDGGATYIKSITIVVAD